MKVLITGASGRFARFVVQSLRDDYELVLFSRSPLPEDRADLPWVQGDLNDFEACRRAVEGIDVIQHLGAVPWPSDNPAARARVAERGRELPPFDATMRTNIMGTYYLMRAAVEAGVQTVVMAGSNCAFGHCSRLSCTPYPVRYLPLDEEHPSDVQESYDYSKWAGEELLASFTRAWSIRTYVTRPAQIYPPDDLKRLAEEIRPATGWSGAFWGYVPSEDLADLHRMIMERPRACRRTTSMWPTAWTLWRWSRAWSWSNGFAPTCCPWPAASAATGRSFPSPKRSKRLGGHHNAAGEITARSCLNGGVFIVVGAMPPQQ